MQERADGRCITAQVPTGAVVMMAGWMLDPLACAAMTLGPPCGIRDKAVSDSDGMRPPNPIQSGHRFQSKAATLLMG